MLRQHGDYVLLQRANKPPWPALIWPENRIPRDVQARRPMGYFTAVLLIRRKPQIEFALPADMLDFDPFVPAENQEPELRHAYGAVLDAMDSPGSSLEYWAEKMDQNHPPFLPSPSLSDDLNLNFKDESNGNEYEQAKMLNLAECHGSVSVTPRNAISLSGDLKTDDDSEDEQIKEAIRLSLLEIRPLNKRPSPSSLFPSNIKKARPTPKSFTSFKQSNTFETFDCSPLYNKNKEVKAITDPKKTQPEEDDYADEDLSKSKAMVKVYIGEGDTQEIFLIPKSEVDRRPSLSDPQIGCMKPMDDGTTHLDLPCFRTFTSDQFRLVAEFLSTGKFGHPSVDPTNRDQYLDDCISAWLVAEKMVLEDLLDLVVVKIRETRPWQLLEVMPLAELMYQEEGLALGACVAMKEMTADAVADNFQRLAVEDVVGFFSSLDGLPELQRDVYRRLAERAKKRVDGEL